MTAWGKKLKLKMKKFNGGSERGEKRGNALKSHQSWFKTI